MHEKAIYCKYVSESAESTAYTFALKYSLTFVCTVHTHTHTYIPYAYIISHT